MDVSNLPQVSQRVMPRLRFPTRSASITGTHGAAQRPDPAPPQIMVSVNHILFLLTMMVLVVPLAFALDPIAGAMRGHWPPLLRWLALETTGWGKAQWVVVPAGIVVLSSWLMHRWHAAWRRWSPSVSVRICLYLFATTGSAELLSSFLKGLFGRPRPFLIDSEGAFVLNPISVDAPFLSFPSGHATAIAASCMAAVLLWPSLRLLMLPTALWLGFTRVVTGAHYPSDVIVGLVLGAYLALMMSIVFERNGLLSFPRAGSGADAASPGSRSPARSFLG